MITLLNDDILNVDFNKLPPINLVVTSPPYNVGIEYDTHVDTMIYSEYLIWCKKWITKMFNAMADDGRLCINIPFSITPIHLNKTKGDDDINYPVVSDYTNICQEIGFKYWRTLVWDKSHSMKTCWGSWRSASSPFMRDPSESILVFYKNKWKRNKKGTSTISGQEFMAWTKNVWKIHPQTKSNHPAAFPLELPNRCIKVFSYKEDVICDPFMGSGTTGEIAARLRRDFIGVEMSKDYFTYAKERIDVADFQATTIEQVMPNIQIDHQDNADDIW